MLSRYTYTWVEIVIAKLRKHKLPGSNQILVELIQAGGEICSQNLNFGNEWL
jgi:hypothetical protein